MRAFLLLMLAGMVACGDSDNTGGGGTAGAGGSETTSGAPPDGGNPSGGTASYPESILCPTDASDPRCGPGYDPGQPIPANQLEQILADGLAAWTDPSSTGGACISCHSPDGIDLAKIGYSDCDIRRRALDHVSEPQADAIVSMIHALRQVHAIEKPLHPDKFRPLQPAYEPFEQPADDVEITDPARQAVWDEQFMSYLASDLQLTTVTTKIDSLELAHQAYDELLGLDLHNVRLGIPFDRFSEDPNAAVNECGGTGGPGHSGKSIFEWVPAIASVPKAGSEQQYNSLLAAYRADPSDQNLWAYYDAIDTMTDCAYLPAGDYDHACSFMRHKFKSIQVLQHMLRHDSVRQPDRLADLRARGENPQDHEHLDLVIARSPIWETADVIRVAPLERPGDPACFSSPAHPCTYLPPDIDATIHDNPTHQAALINQGDLFQVSWFVMSFLDDPTLTKHSHNFATFIGDYLESVLLPRYDIHHAFVVSLMAVHKSAAKEFLNAEGFRQGTGKIASVRTFSFKQLRDNFSPPTGARRETHERIFANFARMWIYLVEEDLRLTGEIYGRDGTFDGSPTDQGGLLSAIRFMRTWIADLEGAEDPAINQLVLSIESLAKDATELRTQDNYDDYDGLQPTNRWADFQTPYGG